MSCTAIHYLFCQLMNLMHNVRKSNTSSHSRSCDHQLLTRQYSTSMKKHRALRGLARLQNSCSRFLLCRLQGKTPAEITERVTEATESSLSSDFAAQERRTALILFPRRDKKGRQSCRVRNLTDHVFSLLWWPLFVTKTSYRTLPTSSRRFTAHSRTGGQLGFKNFEK